MRWWERAWRTGGKNDVATLEFAAALAKAGDPRAMPLLEAVAARDPSFPVLFALAGTYRRAGRNERALSTLQTLLRTVAVEALEPAGGWACAMASASGFAGWIGWRRGRLLFGSAAVVAGSVRFRIGGRRFSPAWRCDADRVWSAEVPEGVAGRVHSDQIVLGAGLSVSHFQAVEGVATVDARRLEGWAWFPHDPGRMPALVARFERDGVVKEAPLAPLRAGEPSTARPFATQWRFSESLPAGARNVGLGPIVVSQPMTPAPSRSQSASTLLGHDERCVLFVTHDEGGGVERHLQRRMKALQRRGAIGFVLRSQRDAPGAIQLEHLRFDPATQQDELLDFLRALRPAKIEYHQLRRHPDLIWDLPARLGVPHDVYLHDYALICPRVTLVGADGQYCGEPPPEACERCNQDFAHRHLFAPAGVADLRRRSALLIQTARRAVAPSHDTARRFSRYVQRRYTVRAHESATPRPMMRESARPAQVCVVGAINQAKGYEVLLACARDAAIGQLPIRFTIVGHTSDDDALIEAGAFVTGPYDEDERAELIARQRPCAGFLPSVWPEPWCYALTGLLAAGLPTLCFDLGAQADRVRRAGGSVVPLETDARAINQELIRLSSSPRSNPHSEGGQPGHE